ncbi:MAG: cytochrome c biogenesis protein ResB [Planctomycetota bacterium]
MANPSSPAGPQVPSPSPKQDIFELVFNFFASVKLGVGVMLACALFFALTTVFWQEPEVIVKNMGWVKTAIEVILVFLTLNLFAVTLSRYPWTRLKLGMLATHAGLIVTFCGAFITTVKGRDGLITLAEGEETDRYFNGRDVLSIRKMGPASQRRPAAYQDFPLALAGWSRDPARRIERELLDGTVVRVDRYYAKFRLEGEVAHNDAPGRSPAIHLTWRGGSSETNRWIPLGATRELTLNGSTLYFNYTQIEAALPFVVQLNDFRLRHYEGSGVPSSIESLVTVREAGKPGYERLISVNNPLEFPDKTWGVWKVTQNSYDRATQTASTFSVSYDPGRPVVYAGFLIVCAGVFFMFWIRPFLEKRVERAPE